MRKFSKIFAVALTLCLIFGVLCTSVFAEEITAKKDLKVPSEGVSNVAKIDFEENGVGDMSYASSKTSNTNDSTYGWGVVRSSTIQDVLVQQQLGLDGTTTNNYLRFKRLDGGGEVNQSAPYWEYYIGRYGTPTHVVQDYSYAVADFDFSCDEYEYKLNGETHFGYEVPEGATDVHLNYPSTYNMYMIIRADNAKGGASLTSYLQLYIIYNKEENRHYCSANTTFEADKDVPLYDIAGAWNHITMVVETDKSNYKNSMLRYYCNGVLVAEAKANKNNAEFIQFDSVRWNISADVVTSGEHFSFCIDNLACNYYALDYESGPDVYGIDDYYADPNHNNINLSNCEDIVYNGSYSYYGTPTPYSAVLEHNDGTFDYSYNIKNAVALIKDGDFVTVTRDVVDYIPHSQDIKEVTFITESGASFTLGGAAKEFYKLQNSGNRYTLKLASDDAMKLTWYDSEGEGREAVKVQKLLPLFVPNDKAPELNIYGTIDKSSDKPTIEILKRWEWDMDNDGYADGKTLSSLTVSDINELREKGVNELSLVPIYEVRSLIFEAYVENSDGELEYFTPNNDISLFTNGNDVSTCINAISAGEEITIVFATSTEIDGDIQIPAGATVNVDLNGKTITSVNDTFEVRDGATFNLYSKSFGGVLQSGYADGDTKSAIKTYKADTCNINIGSYSSDGEEISGDNLTISAKEIVKPDEVNNIVTNALKIYVNVDGGKYLAAETAFVCPTDLVYTITDAMVYSWGTAFSSDSKNVGIRVNVDNSIIASSKFISGWATKGSNAIIENSMISGFESTANVSLGAYNKVDFKNESSIKADGSNLVIAKDVLFAMANNDAVTETVNFSNDIFSNLEASFEFNVLTFLEGTTEEVFKDAVTVTWLDPAGAVHKTGMWYPGSVAKKIAVSFGIVELNNGWYNTKYNDWKNVTEGAIDSADFTVSADADNKFAPVANDYVNALDVSISLQVSEVFGYNVYLPTPVEGVTFDGFYVGSSKLTNGVFTDVTVGDDEGCIRLAGAIDVTKLSSDEITIKYSVNGTSLTKKVKIDVINYVENVADAYECGSDECKVVFAMMNYKLEAYIEATGNDNDTATLAIRDFLLWHSSNCDCLDVDFTEATSNADYASIEEFAEFDYSMLLDSSNSYASSFAFTIQLKKDSGVSAVSGKIGDTELDFEKAEFDGYVEYRALVDLADLNKLINLTLTSADGDLAASYDLAKHIELYDLDIHKALYVISAAQDSE